MSNWYEIETLTNRETIKSALAAANNNQSAAAAELKCTAEQLKKPWQHTLYLR